MCREVSRSSRSLTPDIEHVLVMEVRWTRRPLHRRVSLEARLSNAHGSATSPVGPPYADPPLPHGAPHGRPRGPVWTCVASCHVSVPCAPPTPCVGHPRLCHVASAPRRTCVVVPCATSARHLDPLATSSCR